MSKSQATASNEESDETIMNRWLDSTETLLTFIDYNYNQSCSIPVVPEELINSTNEEDYMPRVVSIGPKFKGRREELLLMEEVKLRSMLSLLHRAGKAKESNIFLRKCGRTMWISDEEIRASYVADIKLNKQELAKIMLLDGCFLLELVITKGFNSQLPSRVKSKSPSPAPQVLKDEDVLSDLILLENQIPILVLHKLSRILFPGVFDPANREERANKINNIFLSILGYSQAYAPNPSYQLESPHILDIVHFFVNSRRNLFEIRGSEAVGNYVVPITDTQLPKLKLKRCASRLQAAGVTIKLAEETCRRISWFRYLRNCFGGIFIKLGNILVTNDNQMDAPETVKGLDFYFKFKKGKLEISQLEITKTTKAKWRNIIAWEHHKSSWKQSRISVAEYQNDDDSQIGTTSFSRTFTSSALIFDGLICCAADVKLLKEKNIIVDHLEMSNEELEEFFHSMSFGVDRGIVDSGYVKMVNDLNNYSHAFFILRILKIFSHLFKYRLEGFVHFFKKNYNFVATVLALLTLVQTVYAVLAYHFNK